VSAQAPSKGTSRRGAVLESTHRPSAYLGFAPTGESKVSGRPVSPRTTQVSPLALEPRSPGTPKGEPGPAALLGAGVQSPSTPVGAAGQRGGAGAEAGAGAGEGKGGVSPSGGVAGQERVAPHRRVQRQHQGQGQGGSPVSPMAVLPGLQGCSWGSWSV